MDQDLYKELYERAKKTQEDILKITEQCDELMQLDLFGEISEPDNTMTKP